MKKSTALRRLLTKKAFGGFVTGASRCTSEPLLTMDEQLRVAEEVIQSAGGGLPSDGPFSSTVFPSGSVR